MTSPHSPLCGSGNGYVDRLCNATVGCPLTINTLNALYGGITNYVSTKNLLQPYLIRLAIYQYAPLIIVTFFILLVLWLTGNVRFLTFLGLFITALALFAGMGAGMYFDLKNQSIPFSKDDLNAIIYKAVSQNEAVNKVKCYN